MNNAFARSLVQRFDGQLCHLGCGFHFTLFDEYSRIFDVSSGRGIKLAIPNSSPP
jgi:hypothetical protein